MAFISLIKKKHLEKRKETTTMISFLVCLKGNISNVLKSISYFLFYWKEKKID